MGCVAMDGSICACPKCQRCFSVCHMCKGIPVKFDKECPDCGTQLNPESMITVGNIVEGENFYYTDKGNSDAVHVSKRKRMPLHNRDGVQIGKVKHASG